MSKRLTMLLFFALLAALSDIRKAEAYAPTITELPDIVTGDYESKMVVEQDLNAAIPTVSLGTDHRQPPIENRKLVLPPAASRSSEEAPAHENARLSRA
ncbi:hypothetical protein LLG95_01115, partial [bacterium]|nr:hypothetical protein [bacterium]